MFDLGWSELLVIAVVLIVVVGPKDLPRMLRTFGRTTKQLRSMAGDFRRQFDEALREADLEDVRATADEVRKLDPRKDIRAAMNPMKAVGDEIRSSLQSAAKAPEPGVATREPRPMTEPATGVHAPSVERVDGGKASTGPATSKASSRADREYVRDKRADASGSGDVT